MGTIRPTATVQPAADVLSDVLAICRSEHAVTARFELGAPWGLSSDGTPGALIRLARGASYWLRVQGQPARRVDDGDLVMLLPGVPHSLGSGREARTTPFAELIRRHAVGTPGENPLVFSHGGAGGRGTTLYAAHVWFSAYCRHTVFRILPPCIHLRASDLGGTAVLAAGLQATIDESLARAPGWRVTAARMGELLLVHLVRTHLARDPVGDAGWLRGIADPAMARVIAAIHRAPQRDWSLAALAAEAALSRTRFAARFKQLVGDSPMGYVTAHRMALAAQALEAGTLRVGQVAEQAGYTSDKVFARAFRRWSGLAPGAWQRRAARQRSAMLEGPGSG